MALRVVHNKYGFVGLLILYCVVVALGLSCGNICVNRMMFYRKNVALMTNEELSNWVKEYTESFLEEETSDDCCFMIGIALQPLLEMMGVSCDLVNGSFDVSESALGGMSEERRQLMIDQDMTTNHYWIETIDGLVIDPTADQLSRIYGLPELPMGFVGKKPSWYPEV